MPGRQFSCRVIESSWLTPTVLRMIFAPSKKFHFLPGQFLSLVIPRGDGKVVKRAYSFASSSESGIYELCIKKVDGGVGSAFAASLKPGDEFRAYAPYGDFVYEPRDGRDLCFISTGSGIAPLRAMAMSRLFEDERPARCFSIFGAAEQKEILYPGFFESMGFETVIALSRPRAGWGGFRGRVTDYLKSLPLTWGWHRTDFYLCGNAQMIADVRAILRDGHGVPDSAIRGEAYGKVSEKGSGHFLRPIAA